MVVFAAESQQEASQEILGEIQEGTRVLLQQAGATAIGTVTEKWSTNHIRFIADSYPDPSDPTQTIAHSNEHISLREAETHVFPHPQQPLPGIELYDQSDLIRDRVAVEIVERKPIDNLVDLQQTIM